MKSYFNRITVRVYSLAAVIMLIGMGFFAAGISERKRLERETDAVYSRAFSELVSCICSINTSLEKMAYATSPEQIAAVSSDLLTQVGFSKSNIGQLPINNADISNMQAFLSQSGDYAYNLTQKAVTENSITDEERENLNMLLDYSGKLAEQLVAMQDGINKSGRSDAVIKIIGSGLKSGRVPKLSNFDEIEQIFSDYPVHVKDNAYKMLDGQKEITANQARKKAAEFCGIKGGESKIKNKGTANLFINIFNFEYGNKFIQVSQKGGYIVNYLADRRVADQLMSDEDAVSTAKAFLLEQVRETEIIETYYIIENGMMTINFAALQDGVILYPDLIKVGVALDNGEVLFYEAGGYLKNHTLRDLPGDIITGEEAGKAVSPMLKINSVNMAVITADSGKEEAYCYEFNCSNDNGKEYIIYVNAETGRQEDILVVIDTGRGKLFI